MAVIPSTRPEADDRGLVAAVRAGDDAAFEELYRRYNRRVAGYVFRMVGDHDRAEDVTQEAFFSALRRLRQTDSDIAFKPWIFEIAKNATIDQFRRSSRAEEVSIHPEDGALRPADQLRLVGGAPAPDAAFVSKERLDNLKGAFDELSDSHTRILVMRELEGLSYREIGERMNLTRPAVESTLFRARRRLNQEYADLDTGARCTAMSAAIVRIAEGGDSARDRRRLGRHVVRCTSCRRHARELGVDVASAAGVRARVAALLPIPALLRRRRGGGAADGGAAGASTSQGYVATVQQATATWAPALSPAAAETTSAAWGKAAAIVAAVALAGGGAAVQERVVDKAGSTASGTAGSEERKAGQGQGSAPLASGDAPQALSPRATEELPAKALTGAGPGQTTSGGRTGEGRGGTDVRRDAASDDDAASKPGIPVGIPGTPDVGGAIGGEDDARANSEDYGGSGSSGEEGETGSGDSLPVTNGGTNTGGGIDTGDPDWRPNVQQPSAPQPPVDPNRDAPPAVAPPDASTGPAVDPTSAGPLR